MRILKKENRKTTIFLQIVGKGCPGGLLGPGGPGDLHGLIRLVELFCKLLGRVVQVVQVA